VNQRVDFIERLGFEPDRFQTDAFDALDGGHNVIVAAPTGAGKTLVASFAVDRAITNGRRVFYTTPIKALSNQKYHDLVADYGRDRVGLLTGDNVINGDAPVVVMTTEVLRNMLYAGRTLDRLDAVVLDEVHYLQDSYRGPVWEEVIIHLPRAVQLVALSATVSNADELAEWMSTVRGDTQLVVEHQRPVRLENLYLVGERKSSKLHLMKTLIGGKANQKGFRFDADLRPSKGRGNRGKGRPQRPWRTPTRVDTVGILRKHELLPAIHFIFSRAACSEAARAVVDSGMVLTTPAEREQIRAIVSDRLGALTATDRKVLEFDHFIRGLEAGVAPHHAGMVPPMKETVEACFVRGLTKVVFATETLALGINMPARTVVLDKLTKWTGENHASLTPAQFTQLTGRAGRRGIDTEGQAVVLWSPFVPFEQVAGLASSKDFVLTSAFRPTYNMAANLVRRYDQDRARQLLNLSFGQFRADADVVKGEHKLERLLDRKRQVEGRLERDIGPIEELRAAIATPVQEHADAQDIAFALSRIQPGDILELDGPDLPSPVATLSVAYRKGRRIKVSVADGDSNTYEVTADRLDRVPTVIGVVELPQPYLPSSVSFIHETSELLRRAPLLSAKRRKKLGPSGELQSVQDVPPQARKMLRRIERIDRDIEALRRAMATSTESLALQFDRVIDLLTDRGHLVGWSLTDSGARLARFYHECDLLLIEALDRGLFDDLSSAEVAALASTFTFEDRRGTLDAQVWYPTPELRRRFGRLTKLHRDLTRRERDARLPLTRQPDPGFMAIAHGWESGGDLDDVLGPEEITAGDFVRTAKLLIDVLRQIAHLAPAVATGRAAGDAADAVLRDLVAASSMVDSEVEGGSGATSGSRDGHREG
jgi:ATP-dependent RNA helicase HelY